MNPMTDKDMRPIVINIKKKKKRKKRYSRGLKDLQQTGRGFTKLSSRLARSVYKGMERFRKASDKSASKKRDGALRDILLNMGKASSKSLRISSRIPLDLAKTMNQRSGRRIFRRQLSLMSRINRRLRMR
jgi:hypothetical protein